MASCNQDSLEKAFVTSAYIQTIACSHSSPHISSHYSCSMFTPATHLHDNLELAVSSPSTAVVDSNFPVLAPVLTSHILAPSYSYISHILAPAIPSDISCSCSLFLSPQQYTMPRPLHHLAVVNITHYSEQKVTLAAHPNTSSFSYFCLTDPAYAPDLKHDLAPTTPTLTKAPTCSIRPLLEDKTLIQKSSLVFFFHIPKSKNTFQQSFSL